MKSRKPLVGWRGKCNYSPKMGCSKHFTEKNSRMLQTIMTATRNGKLERGLRRNMGTVARNGHIQLNGQLEAAAGPICTAFTSFIFIVNEKTERTKNEKAGISQRSGMSSNFYGLMQ